MVVTVLGATETDERNEYSDKDPGAVYVIDYIYTNNGYDDDVMDGLFLSMNDTIVDNGGKMGYSYPGDVTQTPKETPIGATCKAQTCIGVDNPGVFKVTVNKYDGNGKKQSATFVIDPDEAIIEADSASFAGNDTDAAVLDTGETWTVDYSYTNIGYEDNVMDGLFISLGDMVVDSEGAMGYSYPGDTSRSPKETPVGATCDAQACIGVDHAGDFKVTVSKYDSNDKKQSETFLVRVK